MLVRRRWLLTLVLALAALLAGGIFSLLENMSSSQQAPDLPQPQGFHAKVMPGEVKLKWQSVDGAISYSIYRAEGKTGEDIWIAATVQTIFTDSQVVANKAYTYKVTALVPKGEGPPSEIAVDTASLD